MGLQAHWRNDQSVEEKRLMKVKRLISGLMFAVVLAPVRVPMLGPAERAMAADGAGDIASQSGGKLMLAEDDFFSHRVHHVSDDGERGDDRDDGDRDDHHDGDDHHHRHHHHHHHRHHHSGDHDHDDDDDGGHGDR